MKEMKSFILLKLLVFGIRTHGLPYQCFFIGFELCKTRRHDEKTVFCADGKRCRTLCQRDWMFDYKLEACHLDVSAAQPAFQWQKLKHWNSPKTVTAAGIR
jgi:hypothetical protein